MRQFIQIVAEGARLDESSRAPLYHATGLQAAILILQSGKIEPKDDNGWRGHEGRRIVCVSRDERYRYSGAGGYDENGNPVVEEGHAPVQFVLDADALRSRFKIEPHDMAISRFTTAATDPDDPYGGWNLSGNLRRRESEERIVLPPGTAIPLNAVKAIILEPITQDWLRFHHPDDDRPHLTGSGTEGDFPFSSKFIRHDVDTGRLEIKRDGRDYSGVAEKAFFRIKSMAKSRGIPVIDRR